MKVKCLKENFRKAINLTEKAVVFNSSLPILKNILIKENEGKVSAIATNLEMAIISLFNGKIEENGHNTLTVPANILSGVLSNITEEKINFEIKEQDLILKTEKYKTIIHGLPADDFPIIPKIKGENSIEIESEILKNGLASILNIVSPAETKPEISGILFDYEKNIIKLAATDSFRLGEKTINKDYFNSNIKEKIKFIIPIKAVQELIRILDILGPNEEKIKIQFDSNQIMFDLQDTQLISRLVNAKFPDYESIVPKSFRTQIFAGKNELIQSLKLTSIFTGRINDVRLKIPENLKNIEVFSQESAVGEGSAFIDAKIQGEPLEIVFNYKYFIDGLKNIQNETILLGLNESSKPAFCKGTEDDSYFYILMPIKN